MWRTFLIMIARRSLYQAPISVLNSVLSVYGISLWMIIRHAPRWGLLHCLDKVIVIKWQQVSIINVHTDHKTQILTLTWYRFSVEMTDKLLCWLGWGIFIWIWCQIVSFGYDQFMKLLYWHQWQFGLSNEPPNVIINVNVRNINGHHRWDIL